MNEFLDGIGAIGAGLVRSGLLLGLFFASAWVGFKVSETRKQWIGWAAGIGTAVLLYAVFGPSMEMLQIRECRSSSDFDACMDGE